MHVVNISLILTPSNEAIFAIHVVNHFVSNILCQYDLYQVYYHNIAAILVHVGHRLEDIYIHVKLDVITTPNCLRKELIYHFSIWLVYLELVSTQVSHL